MAGTMTFTIIKPGAVRNNYAGPILKMINEAGFVIRAMKMTRMSGTQAAAFYEMHKGKPFYDKLVEFMSSGPIVAAILEKENAIEDFRELIGATDPAKAREGTVRKMFACSVTENAVHGSDSEESANREADFFFSRFERFYY